MISLKDILRNNENIPKNLFRRGNDQEIEFQEIEIGIFQEIESFAKLIWRLKLAFSNFLQN
jgi:hypothetical protein